MLWTKIGSAESDLALTWLAFFSSLIQVMLGNIVGGGVLVGGVYWFVNIRPRTE